jgi:hypothetical protein
MVCHVTLNARVVCVRCAGNKHDFARFGLSSRTPVRRQYICAGTDEPDADQHYLSIIDGETLRKDAKADPVICYARSSEHMSDIKWLNDGTILAATGKGNLKLFHFNEDLKSVQHAGS